MGLGFIVVTQRSGNVRTDKKANIQVSHADVLSSSYCIIQRFWDHPNTCDAPKTTKYLRIDVFGGSRTIKASPSPTSPHRGYIQPPQVDFSTLYFCAMGSPLSDTSALWYLKCCGSGVLLRFGPPSCCHRHRRVRLSHILHKQSLS